MRLDRFLSNLPQFNRKQVRLLLIEKRVQVDDRIISDPHHEVRAFSRVECDGQLLPPPRRFQPAVEGVAVELGEIEARRAVEVEPAIDLPPCVAGHSGAVAEEGVAIRLPLSPIARVVRADDQFRCGVEEPSVVVVERGVHDALLSVTEGIPAIL